MYNPTPEQADADRQKAYETGVPHGVCNALASLHAWRSGAQTQATSLLATSTRARPRSSCSCAASWCVLRGTAPFATSYTRALSPVCASAAQHHDEEYGGPFWVEVSPKMKIDELRNVIRDACGIIPGSQRLSFAGKNFEDSGRSLEQCVPELRSWHTHSSAQRLAVTAERPFLCAGTE